MPALSAMQLVSPGVPSTLALLPQTCVADMAGSMADICTIGAAKPIGVRLTSVLIVVLMVFHVVRGGIRFLCDLSQLVSSLVAFAKLWRKDRNTETGDNQTGKTPTPQDDNQIDTQPPGQEHKANSATPSWATNSITAPWEYHKKPNCEMATMNNGKAHMLTACPIRSGSCWIQCSPVKQHDKMTYSCERV